MQTPEQRRAQLSAWIAETRRNQRRLAVGLPVAAVVALALAVWRSDVGEAALAIVGLVAICGFWITGSHIAEWHARIEETRRADPAGRSRGDRGA